MTIMKFLESFLRKTKPKNRESIMSLAKNLEEDLGEKKKRRK